MKTAIIFREGKHSGSVAAADSLLTWGKAREVLLKDAPVMAGEPSPDVTLQELEKTEYAKNAPVAFIKGEDHEAIMAAIPRMMMRIEAPRDYLPDMSKLAADLDLNGTTKAFPRRSRVPEVFHLPRAKQAQMRDAGLMRSQGRR